MAVVDADVIIAGAGPTGLMLASELCLAGARPLVLERQPRLCEIPRAGGFVGQIVDVLHYRGLLERAEAASFGPIPTPARLPFGGLHVDFSPLEELPLRGLQLPQSRLEQLLDERARELGADVRRGHEVVGVSQDQATVTAEVHGPDGLWRMTARYLVGCDGAYSKVRDAAGIPFPGTTYPEVNRLGRVTMPDSVQLLDNGDLDVPGLGRIHASFIPTDHGVFAIGTTAPESLGVQTTENEPAECTEFDDDAPMTLTELQDSIRRVLGMDIPLGEPIRLSRYRFQARQAERYRKGRVLVAGDAAHAFPATGVGISVGMLDAVNLAWKLAAEIGGWAPPGLLDTYHDERHRAGARTMLHTQAQVALRRGNDTAADALRSLFLELLEDEQPLRRIAALLNGSDTGAFAPDLGIAELMHSARPVFLDPGDRPQLREVARDWRHRIDIHTAKTNHRPADALLIRPDAHIAWAAMADEPVGGAALALREALFRWFGTPIQNESDSA